MLGRIYGGVGEGTDQKFYENGVEYGYGTYGSVQVLFPSRDFKVTVGKYCSIADSVVVMLKANHRLDWVSTYPFSAEQIRHNWPRAPHVDPAWGKGGVTVGNDVWIGRCVTVMSGVKIGDGASIGCNTVVTKDVPPYAVVAGNPGRVVKHRFGEDVVERLLKLKWWDWPHERVHESLNLILSTNVKQFLDECERPQ